MQKIIAKFYGDDFIKSKTQININTTAIKKDIKKYIDNIAANMAENAGTKIVNKYKYIIQNFYNDYTPKYYNRVKGLNRSYQPYYKKQNRYFEGGIILSEDGIDVEYDYGKNGIYAFDSFLDGYHGNPDLGIANSIKPYEYMIQFRNSLKSNWKTTLLPDAKKKARQDTYSLISFK